MLEGMYTAAAGMAAQQQRLDAVANDLANVSTTGYKPVRVAFRDLVYDAASRGAAQGTTIGAGAAMRTIGRSMQQGELQTTGQALDVALEGQGFLAVRLKDGTAALTRDGQLRFDSQQRLVTASGLLLDPPIKVPAGTSASEVKIADDGTVSVRNAKVGTIRLVSVPNPSGLAGATDNAFTTTQASGAAATAPATTRVVQGALEGSAVDLAESMVDLTVTQRAYQLASRAIGVQDQMLQIANEVKK